MKKIMLIATSFITTGMLYASDAPFTYHIGGYFGKNFADKSSKMRDDTLYGIRATTMLTSFYGLSVGYERIDSIDIKDSPETRDLQRIYTQIEVDGEEQYHVVPYITLGAGYESLSDDVMQEGRKYDVSQAYISGGLGFRYNFIPELSIMTEANVLWKTDTSDVAYTAVAGLVYHINATTCDNTYVTERQREKPEERNVIHAGSVNKISRWNKAGIKTVPVSPKRLPKTVTTAKRPGHAVIIDGARTHRPKIEKTHIKPMSHRVKKPAKKVMKNNKAQGYYVMMGAFKKQKSVQNIVQLMEKKHISYLLKDNKTKGLTYVMAGTYPSRNAAMHKLKTLKSIQRDAYIAKMN